MLREGERKTERREGREEIINRWVLLSCVSTLITWVIPSECHHLTVW